LILLDINIPEMDGYEICARLKADPVLAPTPIIFISALNDMLDKVKAFGCGGVDYISKPFHIEEILARVETHLTLRRYQKELVRHNAQLDDLVRLKTSQLAEAHERLSILDQAKNDFLVLISHELRTPLNGLFGVAELLFATYPANASNAELMDIFTESQDRLLRIIEDALLLTEMQVDTASFAPRVFPLNPVLEEALRRTAALAGQMDTGLPPAPGGLPMVAGDPQLFQRALQALLETAVKFSSPGQAVSLACPETDGMVSVEVTTWGKNLPATLIPKFFKVMAVRQSLATGGDLGLSLPLAERIISLFGGGLAVENLTPPGLKITARLKKGSPAGNG
jgi:two-component system, sensor histidine kinase and response regulator